MDINNTIGTSQAGARVAANPPSTGGQAVSLRVSITHKAFAGSAVPILANLQFKVQEREFVSLLGQSGSGKTTILRLIAGLDSDYVGEIAVVGKPVRTPGPDRGMVFQESRLLPWHTVAQNVAFGLPTDISASEKVDRVAHVLNLVNLAQAATKWPHQLSGGMEKRTAIARALVNLPKILLLDEPFSALDLSARYTLHEELAQIHAREGITTVLVTHDVEEAIFLSDRVLVLTGHPAHIGHELPVALDRPRNRFSPEMSGLKQTVIRMMLSPATPSTSP